MLFMNTTKVEFSSKAYFSFSINFKQFNSRKNSLYFDGMDTLVHS